MSERQQILPLSIEDGMKEAYVDYAMSVIVARALPDVRDGFKPVHRRILYTMFEEHITPDRKFRKSASTVGNVIARYHPHGDSAVYDAMVRLAQPFNTRYPLVWPQGNFGSVDGDSPAHMRYTEAKLARISMEMIRDLGKNTVDWRPNFDNSTQEPVVLPALLPNLIINGSEGIAVGMATKIPPHNLREVLNGVLALLEKPEISVEELMGYIPGPDFPTGAIICGQNGIREAYRSGRGSIKVRSVTNIEEVRPGKQAIIVTEIPYQVNKAKLVEEIAAKVNEGTLTGISDLRDESSRKGMRIVIELAQNANAKVVLNRLLAHTRLQTNYSVIMLALVQDVPRLLSLKEALSLYLDHRRQVVRRRTQYELDKALARDHIVQALLKALEHIDEIIEIIENSATVDSARNQLMETYAFSEIQAQAILDMRLQRLTGLEFERFSAEHQNLLRTIAYCQELLGDSRKLDGAIRDELVQLQMRYSDPRRTRIFSAEGEEIAVEDLISNEQMAVTMSRTGYIKRVGLSEYRAQGRGGRGRSSLKLKQDDSLVQLFTCRAHDTLYFLTDQARIYKLKVYELPSNKRGSMGMALVNLLNLAPGEKVVVVIPLDSAVTSGSIITLTQQGYIKRTPLAEFLHIPSRGKRALILTEGDALLSALYSSWEGEAEESEAPTAEESEGEESALEEGEELTNVEESGALEEGASAEEEAAAEAEAAQPSAKPSLFIVTAQGRVLRFAESSVRLQGRSARGVLSITLWPGDSIVGLGSDTHGGQLLLVSERGMGTRLRLSEFNYKGRRARGVWGMRVTPKTGPVAAALVVDPHGQLMVSTLQGVTLRTSVQGVSLRHRGNSGVKFINVAEEDRVIGVAPVVTKDLQLEELPETEPQAESVTALQAQGAAQLSEADEDQEREVESEDYTDFYENLPTDSTEEDLKEEED